MTRSSSDSSSTERRRARTSSIAQAYRDYHDVMSAVLTVAVLAGGGYWLDQRFQLQPLLLIIGLLAGCLLAALNLKQFLKRLDARSQRSSDDSR